MTSRPIRPVLAAAALTALAGVARAEMPAVLDLIPSDALAGVVAPSLSSLDRSAMNLFAAVGLPVLTTPSQMMAESGFAGGLDLERPLALVMVSGPMEGDEPPLALFLPTADHAALIGGLNPVDRGSGVSAITMNGDTVYAKSIGNGYSIVGPMMDVISGFNAVTGQMPAHAKMMGVNGTRAAEGSAAFGFINMPALEPMLADQWDNMRREAAEGFAEGMAMNPMGGAPVDAEALNAAVNDAITMMEHMVRDGLYGVVGLQAGSMGVGAQFAVDFEAGSESAGMFLESGDSAARLAKLPDKPYLFAAAYDLSSEAARQMIAASEQFMAFSGAGEGGLGAMMGMGKDTTGASMALYPSPAGLMGGLFAGQLTYSRVADTAKYVNDYAALADDKNGMMSFGLTRNESTIGSSNVHGWTAAMNMGQNNPNSMQMMQMSQMLFGGSQINGYMVEAPGGVYTTMSRNLQPVQSVMSGEGATLTGSATLAQVRELLPSPAVAETYLNVRAVYDMVMPMAAMFGLQVQTPVPADLPPIGGAMSTGEGGFRMGFFTPAPVLRVGVGVAMEMQAMNGGNQNWDDEDQEEAPF